ncbi:flagellar basal body protein [Ramlibacter terrae]|uniref:Flagellar basal body protein n=1 Tax=Ramlibacter terrae TaxID=2732511 RepID=A0ABX6P7T6_9BURK|nr:flagellar basal body protein [Ramlibacter terrae]
MTQSVEALTTTVLSLALSAAGQRHQAIAANLANATAEGYTPVRLAFEASLADARLALRERGSVDAQSLSAVRIEIEPDVDASGQAAPVHVDAAMVEMARNAVHYRG